jgi:hypothetical protein
MTVTDDQDNKVMELREDGVMKLFKEGGLYVPGGRPGKLINISPSSGITVSTNGPTAIRADQSADGGPAGYFRQLYVTNEDPALVADQVGKGTAITAITNRNADSAAIKADQKGNGPAGKFTSPDAPALLAERTGGGLAADISSSVQGVARDNPTQNVVRIRNTSGGNGPDVLALQSGPSNPDGGLNYITFYDGPGTSVGAVEGNGNGGVEFKTSGADFAEKLPVVEDVPMPEPKDLVGVRGGDVSLETEEADRLMIVSTSPAVTGNATPSSTADDGRRVPVAFVGQAPVRLRGEAKVGDLVVASGREDGTARAVSPEEYRFQEYGPIAGQAWSAKSGAEVDPVTVAVGLSRSGEVAAQSKEQRTQISALQEENEKIKARQQKLEERISRLEAQSGSSVVAGLSGSVLIGLLVGGLVGAGLLWRRRG